MEPVVIPILDHGQVVLLDVFGSDARIAESARVSYGKGTKKTSNDKALLRYLMRHKHTSPFEMCEVLFYLKVPIFVARQLVRHRTANINEVSARYSELPEDTYVPEQVQLGPQSSINNQGRAATEPSIRTRRAQFEIERQNNDAFQSYDRLLTVNNISREISRVVLPLSTYTEMYWKCDLHNFFHFCKLRMDSHAQYEIRVMATAMFDAVAPFFPLSTDAFQNYILYTKTLSAMEQRLLREMVAQSPLPSAESAKLLGMSDREYQEFSAWITEIQATTTGE
jgi:thymidylate synthase (FAD)